MSEEKQKVIHEVNDNDFFGYNMQKMEIALPTGRIISIRERNGEDEELLSNISYAKDGSNYPRFISAICDQPVQTISQVDDWRIADKYYALFASRVQSLGSEMTWKHQFRDGSIAYMEEDLSKYDYDFRTGLDNYPKPTDHNYNDQMVKPYPDFELGTGASKLWFEGTTSSGIEYKMRYLTGNLEKETLDIDITKLNINTRLTLREFHIKKSGAWFQINNFKMFSSKHMQEFRKAIEVNDPEFSLIVDLTSPKGNIEKVSLFQIHDFLFNGA